jgi:hypothetical protein
MPHEQGGQVEHALVGQGAVRADVDATEVQAVAVAAVTAEQADLARPGRMAALICDCLRPEVAARSEP